jgi:hypothetical protein
MGLRVIFGLVVLGFMVGMGQLAFYGVRGQGLFANEVGGAWAIPSTIIGYAAIMLGGFRLRRPFTLFVTLFCLYSIPLTAFLNWPMLQAFWQDILSGRMNLARLQTWETWCFIWNNICLSIDAGILLYLLSYEFRLFGPGKARAMQMPY